MLDDTTRNHAATTDTSPVTLHVGDKVDKYILQEQIGTGNLATVFRARDPILNRNVAVKQIHLTGGIEDDQIRHRVRENAMLQKRIGIANPKHVVQIEDLIDESRGLFVISEFIDGPSLDELLGQDTEPMEPRRALGITAAVAAALEVIHKAGLTHLDLKPANIFLPREGGLKVADAGLAPAIDVQYALHGSTVRYMAPEVLRGEQADGRADLYALGMIGYEMLGGRNNFEQAFKTVLRDQRNQAMRWMKWHTNVRLQAMPLSELLPDLPASYSDLIGRLMEKTPSARIGSAAELLTVIRRHFVESSSQNQSLATSSMTMPGEHSQGQGMAAPGHTAALPAPSKLPLILSATLALWLLVALGVGGKIYLDTRAERLERLRQANALMDDALIALDLNEYDRAQRLFNRIAENWPENTELGFYARGGGGFAAASIAMREQHYQDAAAQLRELYGNRSVSVERVLPTLIEAEERAAFDRGMARIRELIDQREIDAARREMNEWLRLTDMPPTPQEERSDEVVEALRARLAMERQRIEELDQQIVAQELDRQALEVLRTAQRLVANNQRAEAIRELQRGLDNIPGNEALQEMLDRLRDEREFELARSEANAAEATGNIEVAIRRYRDAMAIRPDDEAIQRNLNILLSQQSLAQAMRHFESGRMEDAFEMASEALSQNPDNTQAQELLDRIETANEKQAHMRVAARAEQNQQWDAAIRALERAQEYGEDEDVTAAIRRVTVAKNLQIAQSAIDADNLERAREALDVARDMDPYHALVFALREELRVLEDYRRLIREGDTAQARGEFGTARSRYRDAREVMDTAEIRQRLDDNEYLSLIGRARSFLEREDYAAARAMTRAAQRIRGETEEVQELLAAIEPFLPSPPEEQTQGDEQSN